MLIKILTIFYCIFFSMNSFSTEIDDGECSMKNFHHPDCYAEILELIQIEQDYCLCHIEITDSLKLEKQNLKFEECKKSAIEMVRDSKSSSELQSISKKHKAGEVNGSNICSLAANEEWNKDYLDKQDDFTNDLKDQVEVAFCNKAKKGSSSTNDETPKNIKKCLKSLVKLTKDTKRSIFKECRADYLNQSSRAAAKDCLNIKSYRFILGFQDKTYFQQFCEGSKDKIEACDREYRLKIINSKLSKDINYCEKDSKFTSLQVLGKRACEDILLANIIGFNTNEEQRMLAKCIKPLNVNDTNGINKCLKNLQGNEIDEKTLLEQLSDKYCPESLYKTNQTRSKCLEDLIESNLVDVDFSVQCRKETIDIKNKEQRSIAIKKCERMSMYKFLLDRKEFEIDNCWDTDRYKNATENVFEKKLVCVEEAQALGIKIKNCEIKVEIEEVNQCLISLSKTEDLKKYLQTKAYKLNIDISSCEGSTDYSSCVLDLIKKSQEHVGITDRNICSMDKNADGCSSYLDDVDSELRKNRGEVPLGELGGEEGSNTLDTQLGSTNSENTTDESNSNSKGLGTEGNQTDKNNTIENLGGVVITSGAGITTGIGKGPLNLKKNKVKKDSGMFGFMNDIRNLKIKSPYDSCKAIKKASVIRLAGLVLGVTTIAISGVKAAKIIKDSKKDKSKNTQKESFKAMGVVLAGTGAAIGIKLMANAIAKNVVENNVPVAIQDELDNVSVYCRRKNDLQSFFETKKIKAGFIEYTDDILYKLEHVENHKYAMVYMDNWLFYGANNMSYNTNEEHTVTSIDTSTVNLFKDFINVIKSQIIKNSYASDELLSKSEPLIPILQEIGRSSFDANSEDDSDPLSFAGTMSQMDKDDSVTSRPSLENEKLRQLSQDDEEAYISIKVKNNNDTNVLKESEKFFSK